MNAYDVIIKPIRSEKAYAGIANKKYAFVVDRRADKTQIKAAVEKLFKVSVSKVNTVNVRGKSIEFFDSLTYYREAHNGY